ncbi:MAG: dual specificity protein phosphatase family protein [Planctomycetota bacterium]
MAEPEQTNQATEIAKKPSKTLRRIGWVLLLLLIVGSVEYVHWDYSRHRLVRTAEDVWQSAEYPPEEMAEKAKELGLRTVIDLRNHTQEKTDAERVALEAVGVRLIHIPMHHIPTATSVLEFLEVSGQAENRPTLIHCEQGVARSVLMAAAYRMAHLGWDNERALEGTARVSDTMRLLGPIASIFALRKGTSKGDWVTAFDPEGIRRQAEREAMETVDDGDSAPTDPGR